MTTKLIALALFAAFTGLAALELTGPQRSLLVDGPPHAMEVAAR